jgi:hypothetical protein
MDRRSRKELEREDRPLLKGRPIGMIKSKPQLVREVSRRSNLFPRSAVTRRRLGVDGDAAIASDGDRKRLAISAIRMVSRC